MFERRDLEIGSSSFTSRTCNNKRKAFLEKASRSAIVKRVDSANS